MNTGCFQNYWHFRQEAFSDEHYYLFIFFFMIVSIIHALISEVKVDNQIMARSRDEKWRRMDEGKKEGRK